MADDEKKEKSPSATNDSEHEGEAASSTSTEGTDGGANGEQQQRVKNGSSASVVAGAADSQQTEPWKTGKCKWFNVLKGFGFITPDDGGEEVFVHQSVLQMPGFRSLDANEPVEFAYKVSERGLEATKVMGPQSSTPKGSSIHPLGSRKQRKIRCFNCGLYGNHVAAKCKQGVLPKSCYNCKATDHLVADCPQKRAVAVSKKPTKEEKDEPKTTDAQPAADASSASNSNQFSANRIHWRPF